MSYFNILTISAPNEVEEIHKIRFTPEDSTSAFIEHLYRYDSMAPQLRRHKKNISPYFIQKIAYTENDLELILNRGKAKKVSNIEFLYFTGHAGEEKFGFYKTKKVSGEFGTKWISSKVVLKKLTTPDVKNLIVTGCNYLPSNTEERKDFLFKNLENWNGKFFLGMSAPDIKPLWNRDILSVLLTVFCLIFDKYIYKEESKKNKNIGKLVIDRLTDVYSEKYLERCGVCILWKPDKCRKFRYWDYREMNRN